MEERVMKQKIHIVSQFNGSDGQLITDSGATVAMGRSAEKFAPYELLLGGLSYCLYSTFESIAEKMQLVYGAVELDIAGVKRDEKVATLEMVTINVEAKGIEDQEKFNKAVEISTRYCSVFQTISKVAKIDWHISFV